MINLLSNKWRNYMSITCLRRKYYFDTEHQKMKKVRIESLEVSVTQDKLRLIALLLIQSSSCVLSHLMPQKASIIQLSALSLSLAVFIKVVKTTHSDE